MKRLIKFTTLLAIFLALSLPACDRASTVKIGNDQCIRAREFKSCIGSLPNGPIKTKPKSSWSEGVDACKSIAYYRSFSLIRDIKKECR